MSGAGSEAAGSVPGIEGTAAEPYAKAAGAIVGGLPAVRAGAKAGTKEMLKASQTAPALKAETDQLYKDLRSRGIKYDADGFENMVHDMKAELKAEGFIKEIVPKAQGIVKNISKRAGQSPDFSEMDGLRRSAGRLFESADRTERKAGSIITKHLDDFMNHDGAYIATKGSTAEVPELIQKARSTAQRNIKGRMVEEAIHNAQFYESGVENGLKRQFKRLLHKSGDKFTPEERKAIEAVAYGGPGQKLLWLAGAVGIDISKKGNLTRLLPILGATGGGGGFAAGGPLGAAIGVGTVGASSIAKNLGRMNRVKNANRAAQTVRAGAGPQQQAAARNSVEKGNALARGALLGQEAGRSQIATNPYDKKDRRYSTQPRGDNTYEPVQ